MCNPCRGSVCSDGRWQQPLVLPGFWGTLYYAREERVCILSAQEGHLCLRQLVLSEEIEEAQVFLAETPVDIHIEQKTVHFEAKATLAEGQSLEIRW